MSRVSAHFTTGKFPDIKGPSHEMDRKFYEITDLGPNKKGRCVIYFRIILLLNKYSRIFLRLNQTPVGFIMLVAYFCQPELVTDEEYCTVIPTTDKSGLA
jgi:hypothetical protein